MVSPDSELLEAVKALIEVEWELVQRVDKVLRIFERPPDDPRNKPFPYGQPK